MLKSTAVQAPLGAGDVVSSADGRQGPERKSKRAGFALTPDNTTLLPLRTWSIALANNQFKMLMRSSVRSAQVCFSPRTDSIGPIAQGGTANTLSGHPAIGSSPIKELVRHPYYLAHDNADMLYEVLPSRLISSSPPSTAANTP